MNYPEVSNPIEKALDLSKFREMDYYAVNNHNLPVELMMENAGYHLARLAATMIDKDKTIQIAVGNGNNGGGGLVAARRLAAWGYTVHLSFFTEITKNLPAKQLDRAFLFGVIPEETPLPDLWIDALLGFSQRLPLNQSLIQTIQRANNSNAKRLSLDIPTGFMGNTEPVYFKADTVLTLAAPKKILYHLPEGTDIYVADLGIPKEVYTKFDVSMLPFDRNGIIKLII